jgi:hypothetical protein
MAGQDGARAIMEAERFIESERRRVATRMELVRQMEEAELKETKENVKLLHQCFQNWWGQVSWNWMCIWSGWRERGIASFPGSPILGSLGMRS